MKKFYGLILLAAIGTSAQAQNFIQYGNQSISKEEFLRAFNKNKTEEEDKENAIKEYVDLYTNFKLKVKAAEELRLDTLSQIQFDVANFRGQVIDNYLNDDKGIDRLKDEAFSRSQKDLHVLHFSIPVPAGADTMKANKSINELYAALKSNSDDKAAFQSIFIKDANLKSSDFGFITAFSIPYQYENIVYALKPGEVSKPYRSKSAWHIFKLKEERPNVGRWRIAQILIAVPEKSTAEMQAAAKAKAETIYKELKEGGSFQHIARDRSDDRTSNLQGGELPEFTTGTYSPDFESEVFKLANDGDLSEPFQTNFGYHIVKRIAFRPTPKDKSDEIFMNDLKQKVLKDERVNAEKERFNKQVMADMGLKKTKDAKESELFRFADSLLKNPSEAQVKNYSISNKKILHFKKGAATGLDWLNYVLDSRAAGHVLPNAELWNKFMMYAAMNYYKNNLEQYNPEFAFQMKEFKEGNMLFEIMERNVWSKASNDNEGLQNYYNTHTGNYRWAASADVLIFNCTSVKDAENTLTALKKGKNWRVLSTELNETVQADSGRYELTQIAGVNQAALPVRDSYSAIVSNVDGSSTFVKYVNVYAANQPRSFEEARGLVINDYQQQLEQDWIAQLRKKYPVKVNSAILKEIIKQSE
ncbi:MAG TPA: peptidylprolyl isomerase [Ferruginibacter sp.]|nr:peptidylprolyl isomerase [Ferruginibacter sp.]HRE62245.1 peptidylprolyl isomerase [Ferruginibacter sp.]